MAPKRSGTTSDDDSHCEMSVSPSKRNYVGGPVVITLTDDDTSLSMSSCPTSPEASSDHHHQQLDSLQRLAVLRLVAINKLPRGESGVDRVAAQMLGMSQDLCTEGRANKVWQLLVEAAWLGSGAADGQLYQLATYLIGQWNQHVKTAGLTGTQMRDDPRCHQLLRAMASLVIHAKPAPSVIPALVELLETPTAALVAVEEESKSLHDTGGMTHRLLYAKQRCFDTRQAALLGDLLAAFIRAVEAPPSETTFEQLYGVASAFYIRCEQHGFDKLASARMANINLWTAVSPALAIHAPHLYAKLRYHHRHMPVWMLLPFVMVRQHLDAAKKHGALTPPVRNFLLVRQLDSVLAMLWHISNPNTASLADLRRFHLIALSAMCMTHLAQEQHIELQWSYDASNPTDLATSLSATAQLPKVCLDEVRSIIEDGGHIMYNFLAGLVKSRF